jgi:hypothetical protein
MALTGDRMIHYQLRCSEAHEFDGWFRDSAEFDRQAGLGLVECPACGDVKVTRALMAPAVTTRAVPASREAPQVTSPAPAADPAVSVPVPAPARAAAKLPAHVFAMLQRMRAEVEKHCDYVGPDFAEEARRMHKGESDRRGIYGEATPDEAQSLADEGIEISSIPWVPRADG